MQPLTAPLCPCSCRCEAQRSAAHASNQAQLARKAAAAAEARAEDAAFKEAWAARMQELRLEEQHEAANARERALQVCCYVRNAVSTADASCCVEWLAIHLLGQLTRLLCTGGGLPARTSGTRRSKANCAGNHQRTGSYDGAACCA
jgi:hypothetical protein